MILDFANRMGERLFAVHMLAGAEGLGGDDGVVVIGRGDEDGLDVFALEDVAEITELLGGGEFFGGGGEGGCVDVAEGEDGDVFDFGEFVEVPVALAAETDDGEG